MKHFQLNFLKLILILFALISFSMPSYAAFQFDKIRLDLSVDQPITSIQLSNPGKDIPINLQVEVVNWNQEKGENVYSPTKDLIVAPPILKIAPGKSQVVRIGWRAPKPIDQELSYRMIISDLTPYQLVKNTIRFKVQTNMPIYIKPTNPLYQFQWSVSRRGKDAVVTLKNTGNIHLSVSKLTLMNGNKEIISEVSKPFTALAKQSNSTNVHLIKTAASSVTINAETDNGIVTATVPIS